MAEINPVEAVRRLRPNGVVTAQCDWPDALAQFLTNSNEQRLGQWADGMGLAAETLSRGFRAAYGITPTRFRAEARARRALEMIHQGDTGLASIAIDCGYSDQPHFNRAILGLTGRSPGRLRKSKSFKKGERPPF